MLPDAAIIAAAELDPKDERTLLPLPGFGGRSVRRLARIWLDALAEARALPDDALPVNPPVGRPAAAAPLGRARPGGRRPAGPLPRGGRPALADDAQRCRRRT